MQRFRVTGVVRALVPAAAGLLLILPAASEPTLAAPSTLSAPFERRVLTPVGPESPLELRLFPTAAKTNSEGKIITGPANDPVKNLVGAESAGERAGLERFTKIQFGANYFDGRADPGTRIDPNQPILKSGSQHWPFVPQPFRSWPTTLAVTPDGAKLYVGLPGREGYPDWRLAVVNTTARQVSRWIDLRSGRPFTGTRPSDVAMAPLNTVIYPRAYLVALNQYANFASVIDTTTDTVIGEFETGFYGEKAVFNSRGTRLYLSDRFRDAVRAYRIDPGPRFTFLAEIPTGSNDLERANPRDLALSADERTLYVATTLGNRIAAIDVAGDANRLVRTLPVGGLPTDVQIAGRWGIVVGHETNNVLNQPETGHGLPKKLGDGSFIRNTGDPLGYVPVMSDATRATTFDDIGTELNIFDTTTNTFVHRYVDRERNLASLVRDRELVDVGDFTPDQTIIAGSGAEQVFVRGDLVFVSHAHSENIEVFRLDQASGTLREIAIELTGGITPQDVVLAPDGRTVYVANLQTEDVSFLGWDGARLSRQGLVTVGVTDKTPDPTKGGNGAGLFATHEEVGLRWLFSSAYSDDGQKSCGHCHWQSRHDGGQWNVGANAIGGVKISPQNKDTSDNWPEWFEGLNNDMTAYASACNSELVNAERPTFLFPQANLVDRLKARDEFVKQKTAEISTAIGRSDLKGDAFSMGYYDMAFAQILWTQNETRRMPNPLAQFPSTNDAAQVQRGKFLFTTEVEQGGSGCASCHQNGSATRGPRFANGVPNDTFQDWSIHEPGVISETTVDNEGAFTRLTNDYFFQPFGPLQDVGGRQNVSSRNTKHLRSFWDSVPRWLHHGDAHTIREILLAPDSPLLQPGERGFNFRTVRTDHQRRVAHDFLGGPSIILPTEVPITFADSSGSLGGDGKGQILVSLDRPTPVPGRDGAGERNGYPDGRLLVDQLGTSNLAPLVVVASTGQRQINPSLASNGVAVLRDTHGRTSHLSAQDIQAIELYLRSLQ
jgi:DNA-binding beta-propeller fold protein YncE